MLHFYLYLSGKIMAEAALQMVGNAEAVLL